MFQGPEYDLKIAYKKVNLKSLFIKFATSKSNFKNACLKSLLMPLLRITLKSLL